MPKLLFTSIGRRVQLLRHFQQHGWHVIGVDVHPEECAAQHLVETIYEVPPCHHPQYFDNLLEICRQERVEWLIPLYEPELPELAEFRPAFERQGVKVLVAAEKSLSICRDKLKLHRFLRDRGLPSPDTYEEPFLLDDGSQWVLKPRTGMGSKDVYIGGRQDVVPMIGKVHAPLIQRFIEGQEYSIDVFATSKGQVLSVVPRHRLEVRAGEVSKSVTVVDEEVTRLSIRLIQELELTGPATIQGIRDAGTGKFYFIEVNPRFGGGVPLTIEAGIPYADFLRETYHQQVGTLHSYRTGLKMLRYDEAVFVTEKGRVEA
ncbi:ATP-grasp domain-containing protein [Cohnella xylanilytica]|uniref:ATP-grasp domain-containing protein n=1 Tax=Cohnella xylanilytica TaxID=557555 RepID=A0A841TYN0_9BACL|nr:ATP-grasp domain-containing protein [Cohnella xylanilytica]MBB6692202.1 ATP-grasp domain-containing protein [Cohnella xylanilytica]